MSELKYFSNSNIVCPHCDYKMEDWWDYGIKIEDGHETSMDCSSCEKLVYIKVNSAVTFTTAKEELED